jgi:hypothetical protein
MRMRVLIFIIFQVATGGFVWAQNNATTIDCRDCLTQSNPPKLFSCEDIYIKKYDHESRKIKSLANGATVGYCVSSVATVAAVTGVILCPPTAIASFIMLGATIGYGATIGVGIAANQKIKNAPNVSDLSYKFYKKTMRDISKKIRNSQMKNLLMTLLN